ncbi:CLUMA_CG018073, isoform A [Clunio marinus]|uniref:CLUMA_CG018073, isoform A n=1 Tax=Clunio marinus TaxID=568069 RepID=A0A1J1IZC0_9DIPT|nr:CLUMA_CG018073, isoform A [Clunio marinus]
MKAFVASFLLFGLIAYCYGVSQPVIKDTKTEGCVGDKCGAHCAWEGAQIFPGEFLNQPGKCRKLFCADNFDIRITPCPPPTAEYEWVDRDETKLYPDCCGVKKDRRPKID